MRENRMHGSMRGGWRGISPDQPPTLPPPQAAGIGAPDGVPGFVGVAGEPPHVVAVAGQEGIGAGELPGLTFEDAVLVASGIFPSLPCL